MFEPLPATTAVMTLYNCWFLTPHNGMIIIVILIKQIIGEFVLKCKEQDETVAHPGFIIKAFFLVGI